MSQLTDLQTFAARRFFRNNPKQQCCFITQRGAAISSRNAARIQNKQKTELKLILRNEFETK
jgi:hypothetical protein